MDNISAFNNANNSHTPADRKYRQLILKVAQKLYFVYLLASLVAAISLLILQPKLRQRISLTLAMVVVYGFMVVWLAISNIFFVIIKKEICAIWCNRFVAKMAIMIFPFFALVTYSHQQFLELYWVKVFMFCTCVVSILLIIYEIYACTCGHHEEPNFVYETNDLNDHTDQVWRVRKEYNINTKYGNKIRK